MAVVSLAEDGNRPTIAGGTLIRNGSGPAVI